jgi:hypothetical protein
VSALELALVSGWDSALATVSGSVSELEEASDLVKESVSVKDWASALGSGSDLDSVSELA